MAAGDVYRKTDLGMAEVSQRKLKLPPRLRTMLILVDGVQPELLMREEAQKVGAPPDFIAQLAALGFIEKAGKAAAPAPPRAADEFSQFRAAKDFMNITIVDAMGIKSFFFTMKLERAGTRDDLRELADAYRAAIAKAEGEQQAEVLTGRLRELLA